MLRTIDLFPNHWSTLFRNFEESSQESLETFVPYAKVYETKEAYFIELDVPGLKREDLKLEVEDRFLKVSGERKERYKLSKHFTLPDDVDLDAIEAEHQDGVLRLRLSKSSKSKSREIAIKS